MRQRRPTGRFGWLPGRGHGKQGRPCPRWVDLRPTGLDASLACSGRPAVLTDLSVGEIIAIERQKRNLDTAERCQFLPPQCLQYQDMTPDDVPSGVLARLTAGETRLSGAGSR